MFLFFSLGNQNVQKNSFESMSIPAFPLPPTFYEANSRYKCNISVNNFVCQKMFLPTQNNGV